MTKDDHHLLCLGLLAKLYIQESSRDLGTELAEIDLQAIEQAVDAAQQLGLPVSVKRLRLLLPIATSPNN